MHVAFVPEMICPRQQHKQPRHAISGMLSRAAQLDAPSHEAAAERVTVAAYGSRRPHACMHARRPSERCLVRRAEPQPPGCRSAAPEPLGGAAHDAGFDAGLLSPLAGWRGFRRCCVSSRARARSACLSTRSCGARRDATTAASCSLASRAACAAAPHRTALHRTALHRTARCLSACLSVCLSACFARFLPASCPPACLHACLHACLDSTYQVLGTCSHRKELFFYGSGFGNLFTAGLAALHGPQAPHRVATSNA